MNHLLQGCIHCLGALTNSRISFKTSFKTLFLEANQGSRYIIQEKMQKFLENYESIQVFSIHYNAKVLILKTGQFKCFQYTTIHNSLT